MTELDLLFNDYTLDNESLYCTTTTLPNGLIVKHFSSGEICQTTQEQLFDLTTVEKDRIYLPSGIVIRHRRNVSRSNHSNSDSSIVATLAERQV